MFLLTYPKCIISDVDRWREREKERERGRKREREDDGLEPNLTRLAQKD